MKKFVTASLFIFWAVTVAVITTGLISNNNTTSGANSDTAATGTSPVSNHKIITPITPTKPPTTATLALTAIELAKHNSSQSCWLLISGKIYDVTSFLRQHPGGIRTILPTCGTDATIAYATRGGTGSHSSSADAMLAAYYLGNLNQTIVVK